MGLGGRELLAIELRLKEPARGAFELFDILLVCSRPIRFEKFSERVNGSVWDEQHEPCDVAEDHALLGRHACSQQRAQDEVIKLDDRVGQALAL